MRPVATKKNNIVHGLLAGMLASALTVCAALAPVPVPALADETQATSSQLGQVAVDGDALANPTAAPDVSVPAAIIVDRDQGAVLYAKDADARRYPASTTKIMTALLVLEHANLDDVVTVSADDFSQLGEDSMMSGLKADEQITVHNLLACMLLPSGNDAAYVLARYVGGTWQNFVQMMNDKAAELGCEDTHFANPCGLHDDNHYTTARDLLRIFEAALQQPTFLEVAGSATWELPETNKNPARTLETTDFLVEPSSPAYMDGEVVAGKTGYTLEGGKCLVAAATKDGRNLAGVVLGGLNDPDSSNVTSNFYDMKKLLEWGFDAWQADAVAVSPGDELARVNVTLSEDGASVAAVSGSEVSGFLPSGLSLSDLDVQADLPASVQAPVEAGQKLGEATVSYQGRELGTVELTAASSMAFSWKLFLQDWLADPVHLLIAAGAVVLIVALIGFVATHGRRKRAREEKRVRERTNARRRSSRPGASHGSHFKQ